MTDDPEAPAFSGPPFSRPLAAHRLRRVGDPIPVAETASAEERARVAAFLDLRALDALSVTGALTPYGRGGWRFEGRASAVYAQTCVVTLEPAPGTLDAPIERIWLPQAELARRAAELPDVAEIEPEAGEEPEPMEDHIDPAAAAVETLALDLDPYPRAPDAALERESAAPPGATPWDAAAEKPFAALAALIARGGGEAAADGGPEEAGPADRRPADGRSIDGGAADGGSADGGSVDGGSAKGDDVEPR